MYTSRLPKSTSVRRPTAGESTSFVGLNRPSHIPVTVKKANLFTPHTERRPYYGAASTAGKSSMSGLLMTDRKAQRPMPDKEQQMKMFDELVEFIKAKDPDMPVPEARKFFSSISTTESTRLFEFLLRFIFPEFKITRLEKDVPEVLETLDYPYIRSVTKSALVSVTTRQAAVGLLRIFYWLLGNIRDLLSDYPESEEDDDDLDESAQIYDCIIKQPERVEEAVQEVLQRLYPIIDIEPRLSELREVEEKLENLEKESKELEHLDNLNKLLEADIQSNENYSKQLDLYHQSKLTRLRELEQQNAKLDLQNEAKGKRLELLENAIQNHEYSGDQTNKYLEKLSDLESKEAQLDTRKCENEIELGLMEKKYPATLLNTRRTLDETIVCMRKMLQNLEAYADIGSSILNDRTQAVKDWILRLEQLDHSDLEQVRKCYHDFDLFFARLEGTSPALDSELKDLLLDKKTELESLDLSNKKEEENMQILLETMERLKREDKVADLHYHEQIARKEKEAAELGRKMSKLSVEGSKKCEDQDKILARAEARLANMKSHIADLEVLHKEHLRELCARNKQEIIGIVDRIGARAERFGKAQRIVEENRKLLSKFSGKLKRRQIP